MAKLSILSTPKPAVKLLLFIRGDGSQQIAKIDIAVRNRTMYKLGDLTDTEERKRKGKEILTVKPQKKKKVSEEETIELVKTLKRSEYSVVK